MKFEFSYAIWNKITKSSTLNIYNIKMQQYYKVYLKTTYFCIKLFENY